MFGQIIFGLVGVGLGLVIIVYTRYIVEHISGPIGFAERYLGSAGTYTFWRLLGMVIFFVSLLIMFGFLGWLYQAIVNPGQNIYNGMGQ